MASSNSLSSRLEELRSRNPQSPPGEHVYSGYTTPTRYSGSFMPINTHSIGSEARSSLQRRFTTDSNSIPTLSPIGQHPSQALDSVDMSASTLYKVQAVSCPRPGNAPAIALYDPATSPVLTTKQLEKKRLELEKTREQRRRFDAELEKFNRQQAQEERELQQMASDLSTVNLSPGHQSEPTTPPEYRDQVFSSMYSRRNRYSSSSLVSPPGLANRLSRSGSQLTSPPAETVTLQQNGNDSDKLPSKSVPGSRRGSSDKFSSYLPDSNMFGSRTGASNRYSMPVTSSMKQKRESVPETSSLMGIGHINTASFLFGDDEEAAQESTKSPDVKTYLQMNTTDDKFPILIRNNHQPGVLSASSAALDLALSQSPGPEPRSNGWPSFARHRHSQHSLPQNVFDGQASKQQSIGSPTSSQQSYDTVIESPTAVRHSNRHSMEASLASVARNGVFGQTQVNGQGGNRPNLANMQSSYSTNDIPTLKNGNGNTPTSAVSPPSTNAQQRLHNHNASLGRIPAGAVNNRLSRDFTSQDARRDEQSNGYKPMSSELQASAAPFGPTAATTSPTADNFSGVTSPSIQQYSNPAYYSGYGVQLMNMGMSPIQMGNPAAFANQMPIYGQQPPYGAYPPYQQIGRFPDSQARVIQQRRMQNAEEVARFTNTKIESYRGEIYSLCKDQHGCRYLQKQLEARNPETVHLIFMETHNHVVELMTDPFGNYLCQKLLEHSNDAQRTVLVDNSASDMVKIALNQHGTRALQKMIEFISTPEQIQTIIHALKDKVVELIQDLNGNHVIQKCLNRLTPDDAQFIFDAVGANCVVVGTHRHGCCVLQRCIDHASGKQKSDLIAQITQNAYSLVQDPFGNYVLQYIVDLNDPVFTNPLCYAFQNSVSSLSKQKFSSNVVEKCIRHADPHVATMMVEEMLRETELEKMLRDSYANYVVQTALDYSTPETRTRLTEAIRPILPSIRGTPYGRRIQTKILGLNESNGLLPSPMDASAGGQPHISRPMPNGQSSYTTPPASRGSMYPQPNQTVYGQEGIMSTNGFSSPQGPNNVVSPRKMTNGASTYTTFENGKQAPPVNQQIPNYGGQHMPQANGFTYF